VIPILLVTTSIVVIIIIVVGLMLGLLRPCSVDGLVAAGCSEAGRLRDGVVLCARVGFLEERAVLCSVPILRFNITVSVVIQQLHVGSAP
jgi:uncharacterized membrane protein YedE/YeeE